MIHAEGNMIEKGAFMFVRYPFSANHRVFKSLFATLQAAALHLEVSNVEAIVSRSHTTRLIISHISSLCCPIPVNKRTVLLVWTANTALSLAA
jgi:hypothetical protein